MTLACNVFSERALHLNVNHFSSSANDCNIIYILPQDNTKCAKHNITENFLKSIHLVLLLRLLIV